MKICLFLLSFYFGCSVIAYGQMSIPVRISRELTPARGHYKVLAAMSTRPGYASQHLDSIKFPFDQKMAEEVLSVKPVYLRSVSLDDLQLPAPPANSSQQTRAELDYLLALQNSRTPEDVRLSLFMSNVHESPSDVGRKIGYWAGPQNLPMTDTMFSNLSRDIDYYLWEIKFKYCRARPYMLDPRIRDLEISHAASYPGGHVTYAYIHAYIYQELAPEFTDLFIEKAYAMAHAREIIGVHYPSDSEVSRIFARKFVNLLFQNDQFMRDFDNVKKEWAAKKYN